MNLGIEAETLEFKKTTGELIKDDSTQIREKLATKLNRTVRTIQRALDKLSGEERIRRIGSNKTR